MELTGEIDYDGHAVLARVAPGLDDATVRVWVFDVSCGGCLSVARVELPDREGGAVDPARILAPASEIARLRERLARSRDDGRLEAELTAMRLSDQFRLLGIPELWREARSAIPEKVRLVVNAGWRRPATLSPVGTMPVSLGRERFRATAHASYALPSGGGIAMRFHAFLAGTRLKVFGVRRGLLRVAPVDPVPDAYDIPPLCASWELVGKLDD